MKEISNSWIDNIISLSKGEKIDNFEVGKTPLIKLESLSKKNFEIYAKLEWANPFGSIKDRPAYWMIKKAEEEGKLRKGMKIIEPTSGNMGIALAGIAKALNYEFIAVVPKAITETTKHLIRILGAELLETTDDLCPRVGKGTDQCIMLAKSIVQSDPEKYIMLNQYENEANFLSHYEGTGPEIWDQMKGEIDYFITGTGTGGTITGVSKFLKERSEVKIVAVEPQKNHRIQGLRNYEESGIPDVLARRIDIIDEWIRVNDEEAFKAVRLLAEKERLLVGLSSGAVLAAAIKLMEEGYQGKAVLIFADDAVKYYDFYLNNDILSSEDLKNIEQAYKLLF